MRRGILCAGNWVVDRVKTIDRWPEEGTLCNILAEERSPGGGPCNVLFDLAAMDPELPLYAAGRIGEDAEGEFLLAEIARRGIDDTWMRRSSVRPTSGTDVMSGGGKRTFFHAPGANVEFSAEDLAGAERCPAEFFYLGYLLLLPALDAADPEYGTAAARLLETMRRAGFRTVVDFVTGDTARFRPAAEAALPRTDILILNELEAAGCTGVPLRAPDGTLLRENLPAALGTLLEFGVRELVAIHFPEGAAAQLPGGVPVGAPSCRIERGRIVGTNGAGDAFAAGMLYALAAGMPVEEALRFGGASSYFNLLSASASGGAVRAERLRELLRDTPCAEPIGK